MQLILKTYNQDGSEAVLPVRICLIFIKIQTNSAKSTAADKFVLWHDATTMVDFRASCPKTCVYIRFAAMKQRIKDFAVRRDNIAYRN